MKKYFYDTEFIEGRQNRNTTIPTIDLISIGIVSEDKKEYYAISRDFNLHEAWNRNDSTIDDPKYWIRENVLKSIFRDLCKLQEKSEHRQYDEFTEKLTYNSLSWMLQQHGKTNYQIKREILEFINPNKNNKASLYGYYSAYDHVVFCWLFGLMKNLPDGLPMYTTDLKQMLDERVLSLSKSGFNSLLDDRITQQDDFNECLNRVKNLSSYPKQDNNHNALDDALWNLKLYKFITKHFK